MNAPLSAPRKVTTGYDKSRSLYGGDIQIDSELDAYFASASSSSSKQSKRVTKKQRNGSTKRSRSSLTFASSFSSSLQPHSRRGISAEPPPEAAEAVAEPVVGTSSEVEKDYYRLTSAPVPSAVRPLPVLERALRVTKERWRRNKDYGYCCNQLKSIRQDLTVQHIRNQFACEVYETHGRLALEQRDLAEFSQLLSPLSALYADGLQTSAAAHAEFTAYRILLACHHRLHSSLSLLSLITSLPPVLVSQPAVQHALLVRSALVLANYAQFFVLYAAAPAMGGYLLDELAAVMRMRALRTVCQAYRGRVEVNWMAQLLAWTETETDEQKAGEDAEEGLEGDCAVWLLSMGVDVREERDGGRAGGGLWFDPKTAQPVLAALDNKGNRRDDAEDEGEDG